MPLWRIAAAYYCDNDKLVVITTKQATYIIFIVIAIKISSRSHEVGQWSDCALQRLQINMIFCCALNACHLRNIYA